MPFDIPPFVRGASCKRRKDMRACIGPTAHLGERPETSDMGVRAGHDHGSGRTASRGRVNCDSAPHSLADGSSHNVQSENRHPSFASRSIWGVLISPPKQPTSEYPRSSARMSSKLGRAP